MAGVAIALAAVLAGCDADHSAARHSEAADHAHTSTQASLPDLPRGDEPLALMTSLPLYWPLEADMMAIAFGTAPQPWSRPLIEQRFALAPLDTLSPIAPLGGKGEGTDPLAGVKRLAIIQPRGLSPADNVALDDWVRAGGEALLVLDPALTGHYDVALTDPRHPTIGALIPPVVARWGLEVTFDPDQNEELGFVDLGGADLPVHIGGALQQAAGAPNDCTISKAAVLARCTVGKGSVTVMADAAIFEHRELAGEKGEAFLALFRYAFPVRSGA
ncbi:MAG: hypothetical protein WBA51_18920 [Erythrobacter sp.]